METIIVALTRREVDTVLASLRMRQAHLAGAVTIAGDRAADIAAIAENGRAGKDAFLSASEIDALCERINDRAPLPGEAHSPAPWRFDWRAASPGSVFSRTGEVIARVYLTDLKTRRRDKPHAMNARMMVTAPEMLAALREIVASFDNSVKTEAALADFPALAKCVSALALVDGAET
jgi:hypothetical protein